LLGQRTGRRHNLRRSSPRTLSGPATA